MSTARRTQVAALMIPTLLVSGCGTGGRTVGKMSRPPMAMLTTAQLGAITAECLKYPPNQATRGPYDAAYCDQALAAYNARTWTQPPSTPPARSASLPALR